MSLRTVLSADELTKLRTSAYGADTYMTLFSNRVVLAAQVNSTLSSNPTWAQFNYNNVSVGSYTNVLVDMALLMAHTNDITKAVFYGRVRLTPTSSIIYCNESAQSFAVGDFFWIIDNHLPQARLSRPSTNDPSTAVELVDYNTAYAAPLPVIVGLKTAYIGFVNPSTNKIRFGFDISASYAVASGATISSYAYSFNGTVTLVSGSLSSAFCIVDVTPGEQWLKVTVTDSNSNTATRYVAIRAHDTGSNAPASGWQNAKLSGDISRGWSLSIPAMTGVDSVLANTFGILWRNNEQFGNMTNTLYGSGTASVTNAALTGNVVTLTAANSFVVGQTVIVAGVGTPYDGTWVITVASSTSFSYALVHANISGASVSGTAVVNAQNIDFVGWLDTDSDPVQADLVYSVLTQANFTFSGLGPRMAKIANQLLAFRDTASPTLWGQITSLTPWRGICHFLARYSTINELADLTFDDTSNTFAFPVVTTQGNNIFQVIQGINKQTNSILEFDPSGPMRIAREVAFLSSAARAALPTIAAWSSVDAMGQSAITRNIVLIPQTGKVDGNGAVYNTSTSAVVVFTARAPGYAQGEAQNTGTLPNQILAATADQNAAITELLQRVGNEFSFENQSEFLDVQHPDAYAAAVLIPSRTQLFTWSLDTTLGGTTGVNRLIYDTTISWTIDNVTIEWDNTRGSPSVKVKYRRVSAIGDPGINTTQPPSIIAALPNLGFPAFNFELPELTVPDVGLKLPPPSSPTLAFNGENLLAATATKCYWLYHFIDLTTPRANDVTPSDLGAFSITAVAISPFYTSTTIPAYILANDGTNSAVWYTANVAQLIPIWTKGATTPGIYTVIRATNTSGTILIYSSQGTSSTNCSITYVNSSGQSLAGTTVVSTGTNSWHVSVTLNTVINSVSYAMITIEFIQGTTPCCPTTWSITNMSGYATNTGSPNTNSGGAYDCSGTFHGFDPLAAGGSAWQSAWHSAGWDTNGNARSADVRSAAAFSFDMSVTGISGATAVAPSTNNGSTWGTIQTFGNPLAAPGGFDVQKSGGVSYAVAQSILYKATTLGGAYSSWFTLPQGEAVCAIVPYYKRNTTTLNTSTATPDVIVATSTGKLYSVDGATATSTDISPSGVTAFDSSNCVTVRYGNELAVFGSVSGTYHLFTSTNGGTSWTDIGSIISTPKFIRCRRNDIRLSPNGQLYLADNDIYYSSHWAQSSFGGVWVRHMPSTPILTFDTVY